MLVKAKSNINHDNTTYKKGDEVEVTEKQAADLLAAGVIEPVKGLEPTEPEEAPDRSLGTPEDVNSANEETQKVANLPVSKDMKKPKLIGIARANGLTVEKTATGPEVFRMIEEFRAKNGIVVGENEGGATGTENPTDPTGAETNQDTAAADAEAAKNAEGEAAANNTPADTTPGADAATTGAGEPSTPANPAENAPAQNTTDTDKQPAPAPKGASKGKK